MILSNCQDVNDMLLNQLNSIASLLNLNYYQKGGYLFIIDSDNGKSSVLEKKGDNKYSFSIEKDGENIKVEFDYNSLSIEKSNKFIYMNDNSLYFANNNDDEKSYLDLFYKGDLIFNKENNDIKSHLTIKSENEKYYQIIKENRIKDTTGITNEKIVIAESPYTVANHLIHRYDLNQKMTGGSLYTEEIFIPINDFIEDEISNNPIIVTTVNDMENTLPGIVDYNKKMFPFLKDIQIYKTK